MSQSPASAPHPAPPAASRPDLTFPRAMGVFMLAVLAFAGFAPGGPFGPKDAPPAPAATASPPAASAEGPATAETPAPTTAPAATPAEGDSKALEARVEALSKQVEDLTAKINATPAPAAAPDLQPLQTKVDELSKLPQTVAALPKRIDELSDRVAADDKAMESLRHDLAAVHEQLKTRTETSASPPAETTHAVATADLGPATGLFQKGQYAPALAELRKLEESAPDDARVWYYAALANGLSTSKWEGETVNLVTKGIEREKAGTPASSEIDAAFSGLTDAQGKKWLEYYRQTAKKK